MQLTDAEKDRRLRKAMGVDRIMGADYTGEDENSNPFRDILRFHGITDEFIARKLKEEMEATVVTPFKATVERYNPDTQETVKKTKIVYSRKMVAWDVRQRARVDAQKLLDLYPAEKAPVGGDGLLFGALTGPLKTLLEDIIGKRQISRAIGVKVREIPEKIVEVQPERSSVRLLSFLEE